MKNLKQVMLILFSTISLSVLSQTPNGDTLIINGNSCQFPEDTIFTQMQNCNLDFNSIDSAYISYVDLPTNPTGNMTINWTFLDTSGVVTFISSYAPNVNVDGCYEFTFTIYCYQKSLNIKTIIVTDARALFFTGLNEIDVAGNTLIKVTDLMGRECEPVDNQVMLYYYSNGEVKQTLKSK